MLSKMRGVCLHYGCVKCCLDTEMPLCGSDIARIRGLGFSENSFVVRRNGSRKLRNLSGRCVFHDGHQCTIYNSRPEGCRLYPAIFHEGREEVVLDSYCPHHEEFQLTPITSRKVIKLVQRLDKEKKRGL
jgi:Fe-S-cluster containining protein